MELKFDVKTLVIGIAIGVAVTAVIGAGYGGGDKADFGIAVPSYTGEGSALIRTADDALYVVSVKSGMAVRVLQAPTIRAEPYDRRDAKGRPFSLNISSQSPTKNPGGAGY
jgi:hypothetical protein